MRTEYQDPNVDSDEKVISSSQVVIIVLLAILLCGGFVYPLVYSSANVFWLYLAPLCAVLLAELLS